MKDQSVERIVEGSIRKFMVVAVPRSGSTFLIKRIAESRDVYLPEVNQFELFNVYEKLYNCHSLRLNVASESQILDGFFSQANRPYAGLKTIPGFHREWPLLMNRPDIQFITLLRCDFLSCLASYIICERQCGWRLSSRQQIGGAPLVFREIYSTEEKLTSWFGATLDYLLYNYRAVEALNALPQTIQLETGMFEQRNQERGRLAEFLGRPISFDGFTTPTHYTECFSDHFFFKVTVKRLLRVFLEFDSAVPRVVQSLLNDP